MVFDKKDDGNQPSLLHYVLGMVMLYLLDLARAQAILYYKRNRQAINDFLRRHQGLVATVACGLLAIVLHLFITEYHLICKATPKLPLCNEMMAKVVAFVSWCGESLQTWLSWLVFGTINTLFQGPVREGTRFRLLSANVSKWLGLVISSGVVLFWDLLQGFVALKYRALFLFFWLVWWAFLFRYVKPKCGGFVALVLEAGSIFLIICFHFQGAESWLGPLVFMLFYVLGECGLSSHAWYQKIGARTVFYGTFCLISFSYVLPYWEQGSIPVVVPFPPPRELVIGCACLGMLSEASFRCLALLDPDEE